MQKVWSPLVEECQDEEAGVIQESGRKGIDSITSCALAAEGLDQGAVGRARDNCAHESKGLEERWIVKECRTVWERR